MTTTFKVRGNVISSNINYTYGLTSSQRPLKLKTLNCDNLSLSESPQFAKFSKTLKIPGVLKDLNSTTGTSLYWSSYSSQPSAWNNTNFTTTGINDNGNVVGSNFVSSITSYYSSFNGTKYDILNATPIPYDFIIANSINNSGTIVGYGYIDLTGIYKPLLWTSYTSRPTVLSYVSITTSAQATSINNNGNIVGINIENDLPIYWNSRVDVPVACPNVLLTAITSPCINLSGNIIFTGSGYVPVYLTSYTSVPVNIPTGSFTNCNVTGINNNGNIVGFTTINNYKIPLYWSSYTSDPVVMSTGSYFNFSANCINNNGIIS